MRRLLAFILLIACALVVPVPQTASAAVDPEITVTLEQDQTDSRVGSSLELTAKVEVLVGAEPLEWGVWYVEFTGTAEGGWSSGAIATDDGEARYVRPAGSVKSAQTETITATLVSAGCSGISDSAEHVWYDADRLAVTLSDEDVSPLTPDVPGPIPMYYVEVGTQVTLAAQLLNRRTAVQGAELRIQHGYAKDVIKTDSTGVVRATWSQSETETESVIVTELSGKNPLVTKIDIFWFVDIGRHPAADRASDKPDVNAQEQSQRRPRLRAAAVGPPPPLEIELRRSVPGGENRVGTEVTWSAEVFLRAQNEDRILIKNIAVSFKEAGGRWSETADTAADGVATLPAMASGTALTDTVTASVAFDGCGTFVSAPLGFEWWEPKLTLTPLDATSAAGDEFELKATLTQSNGKAIHYTRLALTAHSTQCSLNDLTVISYTDGHGVAAFPLSRGVPTTDLITVAEEPGAPDRVRAAALASATTTHTWTPAIAPNISVDLRQNAPDGRIGSNVTVSATVARPPTDASPGSLAGIPVTFSGFDGGPVVKPTDPEGRAEHSYPRSTPGTDHIVASVPYGCATVSDAVDHEWWVPTLSLAPADTTTDAGEDVDFTGWLRHSAAATPLVEQELTFTLHSSSCNLPDETRTVLTDSDGRATVSFGRAVPSQDTVTVRESESVLRPQVAQAGHTWGRPNPPPIQLRLQQSSPDSRIGERVTLSARVTVTTADGSEPGDDRPVRFVVNGSPAGPIRTNDQGVARYTYTRKTVGADQVTATTPYGCDVIRSDELDHRWWHPELGLAPLDGTSTVGDSVNLTATLREGTRVLPGRRVRLIVHDEASVLSDTSTTDRTDARGRAAVRVRRTTAGVLRVTAVELAQPGPARATTRHTWVAAPDTRRLTLVATPAAGEAEVGEKHTVVATTEFGGGPQKGVAVTFTANKPDETQREGSDVSGPLGRTFFTYTREEAGTDQIVVRATFRGQTVSQTVTQDWTEQPAEPELTLGRDNLSSPVGKEFIATAVVKQDGEPQSGVRVDFIGTMAGEDITNRVETDDEGEAQFTIVRDAPGEDLITATASVDGDSLEAEIHHTWIDDAGPTTQPPSPPSVSPRSPTARPGGDLPLSGTGCTPGTPVVVYLSGEVVGQTTADGDGNYQLRVPVPKLPLGHHVIRATCGSVTTISAIDLNLPQSNGSAAAAGATSGSVLLFFVLLANALMHGMRGRFD